MEYESAKRANHALGSIRHSITSQVRETIALICSVLVWPDLGCCEQVWAPQYKKDKKLLKSVQRKVLKTANGLQGKRRGTLCSLSGGQ